MCLQPQTKRVAYVLRLVFESIIGGASATKPQFEVFGYTKTEGRVSMQHCDDDNFLDLVLHVRKSCACRERAEGKTQNRCANCSCTKSCIPCGLKCSCKGIEDSGCTNPHLGGGTCDQCAPSEEQEGDDGAQLEAAVGEDKDGLNSESDDDESE